MKLSEYLKKHKLTQEEFAKMVGVARPYITTIISGNRSPSPALINKIQDVTKKEVSFDDLFNPDAPTRFRGINKED